MWFDLRQTHLVVAWVHASYKTLKIPPILLASMMPMTQEVSFYLYLRALTTCVFEVLSWLVFTLLNHRMVMLRRCLVEMGSGAYSQW
jgi:hypothetical protein